MAITEVLLFLLAVIHAAPVDPYGRSNSLDLRDAAIRTIKENQFSFNLQIKQLDLSSNRIFYIHPQGFCGLNSLYILDLSYNEIRYLHPDTFKCTPSLERLILNNNIKLGSGANNVFLSTASITTLDISFCDFKILSNKMFSDMTNLKKVIAYNNPACQKGSMFWNDDRLECVLPIAVSTEEARISQETSSEQKQYIPNVQRELREKLTVGNYLMKLDSTSTETSTDIETSTTVLRISVSTEQPNLSQETASEQKKYIPKVQDEKTEKLTVRNSLMKLDDTSTETSKDIETSTTVLPISVSTEQPNLSQETASEQKKYIPKVQDEGTEKLTVGSSLMKINSISTEASKDTETSTERQITNEHETVDVIETKKQRNDGQTQLLKTESPTTTSTRNGQMYEEKELLENILLKYKIKISKTREIPAYYFDNIRAITSLDLSDLNILSIHRLAFCDLNSLTILNLSTNNLQFLHPDTFHCTPHLQELKLSNNPRLGLHSHSVFIKSRSLEQLDISFCNFASLPGNMLAYLPNLKFFDAVGNPGCPQIVSRNKDINHIRCSDSGLGQEDGSSLSTRGGENKHVDTSPRNEQSYYQDFTSSQNIAMLCFSILIVVLVTILYVRYKTRTGDNIYEPISTLVRNPRDNHEYGPRHMSVETTSR